MYVISLILFLVIPTFLLVENLIATSYESYESLLNAYPDAESNIGTLVKAGIKVMHGIDAAGNATLQQLIYSPSE